MNKSDRLISNLMFALSLIERASNDTANRHAYINGVATMAQSICNAQRERNADGYLVVKE